MVSLVFSCREGTIINTMGPICLFVTYRAQARLELIILCRTSARITRRHKYAWLKAVLLEHKQDRPDGTSQYFQLLRRLREEDHKFKSSLGVKGI